MSFLSLSLSLSLPRSRAGVYVNLGFTMERNVFAWRPRNFPLSSSAVESLQRVEAAAAATGGHDRLAMTLPS